MTKEELAAMLDGRQYFNETTPEIEEIARENNLLIVYGQSDDLCEFRGAISDEFGCFNGGIVYCSELPKLIVAEWDPPKDDCSWTYKTDMPYSEFKIYDDNELYCIGIVIDLNEARSESDIIPSPELVAEKMLAVSQHDIERSHIEMDEIMLETLEALGYTEAVRIFRITDKYYS